MAKRSLRQSLRTAQYVASVVSASAASGCEPSEGRELDAGVACMANVSMPCSCGEREGTTLCTAARTWAECSCRSAPRIASDAGASTPAAERRLDAGQLSPSDPARQEQALADAEVAELGGDLPCDVRALLARRCSECHGEARQFGAPMSLTNWDELQRPVASKPAQTVAQLALARMRDDANPMPPASHERLSSAEVSLFASWLEGGAPKATTRCDVLPGPSRKPADSIPKPGDCEATYEVRAHGGSSADDKSKFKVSPKFDDRQYQCFYFDAPYSADAALFWYEPIVDNVQHAHHWILYATDNKLHEHGTTGLCNAAEPGAHFVAGWGPGTNNAFLPDDVALDLHTGPKSGLILELHYFNDTESTQEDASGVRFCTGRKDKRAHLAGVQSTGSEGICLEPGSKKEVAGVCTPRTDLGDIHITGLWPHMHKHARRMVLTINRAGGRRDVIHDAPFDFGAQLYYVKEDVVLHPGDTLETRCFYDNDTASRVGFGVGTQDEMCYGFVTAWPVGALSLASSGLGELRSDLLNRCVDLLSVLGSCNGLADAL